LGGGGEMGKGGLGVSASAGSPLKRKVIEDSPVASTSSPNPAPVLKSATATSPVRKKGKKNNGTVRSVASGVAAPASTSTATPVLAPGTPNTLTDTPVIEFLRQHPQGVLSSNVIKHFSPFFQIDNTNKALLSNIVKRVADMVLVPETKKYLLTLKKGL
jgi:hypothetical protein